MASTAGEVGAYGGTPFKESLGKSSLNAPVVGMAATPDGQGYWLAAADGGVFAFGDAAFLGSIGNNTLNKPVVGMAATPDGQGYWLAAADGGVFAFGDAHYYGSGDTNGTNGPVVGIAPTPDGLGYWLVTAAGGVQTFGDAPYFGAIGSGSLNEPVVGMATTPDGLGYWLVAADGGVFSFGDAHYFGSVGDKALNKPVVAMAPSPDGQGYWLVAADGGVFAFGSAPYRGSASGYLPSGQSISAVTPGPGTGKGVIANGDFLTPVVTAPTSYAHGTAGYDISYPQCGQTLPATSSVAVVGVNRGSAFTVNPCFASEAAWAGPNLNVYMNLNSPEGGDPTRWSDGPDGTCASGDLNCESYNYGFNAAQWAMSNARSAGYSPPTWWLDIETSNFWTTNTAVNDQVIAGALQAIHLAGDAAAIYSTDYQWGQIAGNYVPDTPAWYATGVATFVPQDWCSARSFAGGPVALVQGRAGSYDGDYTC